MVAILHGRLMLLPCLGPFVHDAYLLDRLRFTLVTQSCLAMHVGGTYMSE